MNRNIFDIQTISTKRTDKQAKRFLLFRQVTIEIEKADPSHFLKFLLVKLTNGTFGFARHTSRPFAKPKEPFWGDHFDNNHDIRMYSQHEIVEYRVILCEHFEKIFKEA